MLRATKTCLIAVTSSVSSLAFALPAQAVTDYGNCDQMHRAYRYGVARSTAAADRQQRTDHYRPAVRPAVYRANAESDADRDGTACEVTR